MTIITVWNEKGGVGKTTSVVHIARCLKKQNKKVMVIDLDSQGNSSQYLGYDFKDNQLSSADIFYCWITNKHIDFTEIRKSTSGIDYIPSSQALSGIPALLMNIPDNNYILKKVFCNEVLQNYDYILIDCRTSLDLLVTNALVGSDYVIIPVESGIFSYDGLFDTLSKIEIVKTNSNSNLNILGIILNKKQRTNISQSIEISIRNKYQDLVFNSTIPFCPAQAEKMVMEGLSLTGNNSLEQSFEDISRELENRIQKSCLERAVYQ